jgi:hypothetical protein
MKRFHQAFLVTLLLVVCAAAGLAQTIGPYTSGSRALVNQPTATTHIPLEMSEARGWVPLGCSKWTVTSSASKSFASTCSGTGCVTLPATAKHAVIIVAGGSIRWRDDNYNPTTSEGLPYPVGKEIVIEGSRTWLSQVRFIAATSTSAEVNVCFYKNLGE